jgi:hypothetical protein
VCITDEAEMRVRALEMSNQRQMKDIEMMQQRDASETSKTTTTAPIASVTPTTTGLR